MVRFSMKLTDP